MIVFDLRCDRGHVFEAWFGNSASFKDQSSRGLLSCALCDSKSIEKAPMAAFVPTKTPRAEQRGEPAQFLKSLKTDDIAPNADDVKTALRKMAQLQAEVLKTSKWVGKDFDRQARLIDDGTQVSEAIHGEVTAPQAKALIEDGIAVAPLPFPVIPPEKQN
jgi:hypothetical protein